MGEMRNAYKVLARKPEEKRKLGRTRRRLEDNIRTDLREIRCGYVHWMRLSQNKEQWRTLVNNVINLLVP
jgi:hypothetical protein